ncbi:pantoate--beta-alanine ligase [Bacillus sp. FJAT-26390]|uniref:pantoate--beta-alanine ligase n=1 Tax=Bacillus sp. FJAT-26390 TaxID=1743142 RepID=UPI000808161E|nr:pantoate--beta-alanine ligase [Bacillus sp. FJAT-26390]OBZ17538.1 pantoate--beta-alanine ligase [Bacillus sp. FJAT-26390]
MIICRTKAELKEQLSNLRQANKKVGLVPTMGYLHEGHASLLRQARSECEVAVLSIFVNPLQFGPNEDLDRYPRDEKRDLALAEECGTDIVFIPSVEEMYPSKPLTMVIVNQVTDRLCGASRPGHFDGVGTVVSKLFHLVAPDRAYFGMKDAQQVAVIEQMVHDLNFPVQIVPCPIVREPDGLALSSRNVYLNAEQRGQAVILSKTLQQASEWAEEPEMTVERLQAKVKVELSKASEAVIDYVELLHYPSLQAPEAIALIQSIKQPLILALAVKFGTTRLIDNQLIQAAEVNEHVQNDDEVKAAPGNRHGSEPELCR